MEVLNLTKALANTASYIYAKSWKVAYSGIIPQEYLDNLTLEHWTQFLENSPFQNFLLKDNDDFVATSSVVKSRDEKYAGYGEIVSLYVLPDYFGKGYGTYLFKRMVEKLRAMGFNKVCLWVLKENVKARQFYEKLDLIPNGDEKSINIGGKDLTVICYIDKSFYIYNNII